MKKHIFLLFTIATLSTKADTYSVLGEPKMSPYAMAENWITATYGMIAIEDAYLNPNYGHEGQDIIRRGAEWVFIWSPLCEIEMVTNHEIFGHGYRIRDLGSTTAQVVSYHIRAPFPYSSGGGETDFIFSNNLQPEEMIDISIAGMEASNVLANRIKMNWMQSRKIDGRAAALYFISAQDTTLYIASAKNFPGTEDGNDVLSFVQWYNIIHPNAKISHKKLKENIWLNILDPITFYTMYAAGKFIAVGKEAKIWMIPFGGEIYYLPNMRYSLAPYGPEKYFENYFSVNGAPIYFYIKTGKNAGSRSWGAGLEYPQVLNWRYLSLGGRIDLWKQNSYTTKSTYTQVVSNDMRGIETSFERHMQYGISAYLIAAPSIPNTPAGFLLNLGFKSKGYQPGESLDATAIIRFGLTAKF